MGVPPNHSKLEHFSIETNGDWGSSIFRNPPNIGDVTPRLTFGSAFMRLCVLIILYIYIYIGYSMAYCPLTTGKYHPFLSATCYVVLRRLTLQVRGFPDMACMASAMALRPLKLSHTVPKWWFPNYKSSNESHLLFSVQLQNELRAGFVEGLELSFTVLLAAWHVLGIPFNNPGTADIHRFLFPDQHRQGRTWTGLRVETDYINLV